MIESLITRVVYQRLSLESLPMPSHMQAVVECLSSCKDTQPFHSSIPADDPRVMLGMERPASTQLAYLYGRNLYWLSCQVADKCRKDAYPDCDGA